MGQRREDELFTVFSKEHEIDDNIVLEELEKAKNLDADAEERIFAEYEYYITTIAVKYCFGNYERIADLVQEGYLALHQAIQNPKITDKNFRYVARHLINSAIRNAYTNEKKNTCFKILSTDGLIDQYKKLISSYFEHYHLSPSDDFIMDTLGISYNDLVFLKNELQVQSDSSLMKIVEKHLSGNPIDYLENRINDEALLSGLQSSILDQYQYYLIYQLAKGIKPVPIARELGLHKRTIYGVIKRTMRKINANFHPNKENGFYFRHMPKQDNRIKPLSLREIAISYYLRGFISKIEYSVYYDCYVSRRAYTDNEIKEKYGLSQTEFEQIIETIQKEIKAIPEDFLEKLINKLKKGKLLKTIFALDISPKKRENTKKAPESYQKSLLSK